MALTLEKAVHDLEQDGVTIIPNVFRPEQIARFRAQYDRLFTRAMDIVQQGPEDSYELITHFDKEVRANKTAFADGEGGSLLKQRRGGMIFPSVWIEAFSGVMNFRNRPLFGPS
tara:strand:- start:500 stop:841 length:342 start_codon:yes stop_codon:yes gene_type:complete